MTSASSLNVGLIVLSLICAGGLYVFVREAWRLQRLIESGTVAQATVLKTEKVAVGSGSVVSRLVWYEFLDEHGQRVTHRQDLNNAKFFGALSAGDPLEVVYERSSTGNSYPLSQVRAARNVAAGFCAGILALWGGLGAILV